MRDKLIRRCSLGLFAAAVVTQPSISPLQFVDSTVDAGLAGVASSYGLAVSDIDNDGWEDVFIAGPSGSSRLFRNTRSGTFEDITASAGIDTSGAYVNPLWADVDGNGFEDLFLGSRAEGTPNRLYLSQPDLTFEDVTESTGELLQGSIGSATFGDFNGDGRPDLFLATRGSTDKLLRNTGSKEGALFEDVSGRAGIGGIAESIAMQATWRDFDNDGDQDLFVIHDANLTSRFYRNDGFLPFKEITNSSGLAVSRNSMGIAWGDYDNDGFDDVYVTNIGEANLFRNLGDGTFEDVTEQAGVARNGMSWGAVWGDFDNDADLDLYVVSTHGFDGTKGILYRNDGGSFTESESGSDIKSDAFGLVSADFNNDGRLDLLASNLAGSPRYLENQIESAGNWIQLMLFPTGSIGARVRLYANGREQSRVYDGGSGYCSRSGTVLHFGLGDATEVDSVRLDWSSVSVVVPVPDRDLRMRSPGFYGIFSSTERPSAETALRVYPNPFREEFHIETDLPLAGASAALYDVAGRRVASRLLSSGSRLTIATPDLAPGAYLLLVETPTGEMFMQVITKH